MSQHFLNQGEAVSNRDNGTENQKKYFILSHIPKVQIHEKCYKVIAM